MAGFQERWKGYFQALDGNSNGFLEPEDAIICSNSVAARLGFSPEATESLKKAQIETYSEFVKAADKNNDGKVSLDEFLSYAEKAFSGKKYEEIPAWFRNNLESQAKNFDIDGNGILDLDEWKAMNAKNINKASDADFEAAFKRFAGGNSMTLEQFKNGVWQWATAPGAVPDIEAVFPIFKRQW